MSTATLSFSVLEKIKCLERELALRQRAYPRWVQEGKLNVDKAAHEIGCIRAMLADYRGVLLTIENETAAEE